MGMNVEYADVREIIEGQMESLHDTTLPSTGSQNTGFLVLQGRPHWKRDEPAHSGNVADVEGSTATMHAHSSTRNVTAVERPDISRRCVGAEEMLAAIGATEHGSETALIRKYGSADRGQ